MKFPKTEKKCLFEKVHEHFFLPIQNFDVKVQI